MPEEPRKRIIVPSRAVNGGMDFKFETDPYDVKLHGIISAEQYTDITTSLNDKMKPARSKHLDTALLAAGPLMVPLAVWGVRHGHQTKWRKRILKEAIEEFNANNSALYMRWNRRPQSFLSIERRAKEAQPQQFPTTEGAPPFSVTYTEPPAQGGEMDLYVPPQPIAAPPPAAQQPPQQQQSPSAPMTSFDSVTQQGKSQPDLLV